MKYSFSRFIASSDFWQVPNTMNLQPIWIFLWSLETFYFLTRSIIQFVFNIWVSLYVRYDFCKKHKEYLLYFKYVMIFLFNDLFLNTNFTSDSLSLNSYLNFEFLSSLVLSLILKDIFVS